MNRARSCLLAFLLFGVLLGLSWPAPARAEDAPDLVWSSITTAQGLSANAVLSLLAAPDGILWAGTTGGVSRWDGRTWQTDTTAQGLGDNWVTALAADAQGRVWAGTFGGGLSVWQSGRWTTYTQDDSGLAGDWVTALAVDREQRLWVGTFGGGVSMLEAGRWTTYKAANSALSADWITALAIEDQGTVWVGTHGKGVCALTTGLGRCYSVENAGLISDAITALALSPEGRLWIGSEEGLNALDIETGAVWSWEEQWNLPNSRVRALALDGPRELWVGTGAGLAAYNGGDWQTVQPGEGLRAPVVSALATDRNGALWMGTLGGGLSRYGEGEALPTRPPRPVILVHGWRGPESDRIEDSEFSFLRRWLERDGLTTVYATGIDPRNTLHENAAQLRDVIARAKAATGSVDVDLIAFSMGGLNSRAYLESALYAGDVHRFLDMGTPHAGVTLWKTFLLHEMAHWTDEPSARELLPEHVALLNATHANNGQVPYYLFAGSAQGDPLPPLFDLLPPSDGLISAWSAHALQGPAVRYITTPDLHAWSDESILLGIPSFLWPSETYDTLVRPILREEERAVGMSDPPAWAPLGTEVHSPLYSGEIRPGQTVTQRLELPAGTNRVYVRAQSSEIQVSLRNPAGRRITQESVADDISYFALPMAGFESYVLTATLPGSWTVLLEAPSSLAEPTGYALYAVLDSPLRLAVAAAPEWAYVGQPVTLRATLTEQSQPVATAVVSAEIYTALDQSKRLTLYDDGQHQDGAAQDGIYANQWTAAGVGGYYPFFVTATGTQQGRAWARGAEGVLLMSPDSASFLGDPTIAVEDADHDGRYERLRVEVGVQATRAGHYLLSARLLDTAGAEIARVALPLSLQAGTQRVSLAFESEWITRRAVNGPYLVDQLWLLDASGAAAKLDEQPTLQTPAYRWQDFASP